MARIPRISIPRPFPFPLPQPQPQPQPGAGAQARGFSGNIARRPANGGWSTVGEYRTRKAVKLDGSGNGNVLFDVRSSNQRYIISSIGVFTDQAQTTAPYPTATVYEGPRQAGMIDGQSWTGNSDVLNGRWVIDACDDLTVDFTAGVAGSVATVILEGSNQLRSEIA